MSFGSDFVPSTSTSFPSDNLKDNRYLECPTNPSQPSYSLLSGAPYSSSADYDYAAAILSSHLNTHLEDHIIPHPTLAYNADTLSDQPYSGRHNLGFNPSLSSLSTMQTSAPTAKSLNTTNADSGEGKEEEYAQSGSLNSILEHAVRKQQAKSGQKRRDNLRGGYDSLRSALPPTNRKLSQVKLLNSAMKYIRQLKADLEQANKSNAVAAERIRRLEIELRLRDANGSQAWRDAGIVPDSF
ncbi:hypothetical protein BDP27DRAFT_526976 [Rhodocollybia butyracea]|uniref:BHLH domain-containing protein n=1 Tax=Rhodocollybia butyracea TaxID=206335 RepID=A0A9P5PY49_9AGAR|nr:hypothetical protein BDP27DRAFT_526976 [Rhodocollybia butyracea]